MTVIVVGTIMVDLSPGCVTVTVVSFPGRVVGTVTVTVVEPPGGGGGQVPGLTGVLLPPP